MNLKKIALRCAPVFLVAGCATPQVVHRLDDECLHTATAPDGDTAVAFDEACGRHKVELADRRIRVTAEEARTTIEAERNAAAWKVLAISAFGEINNPQREDEYSQIMILGLTNSNPAIRQLAFQAAQEANQTQADISVNPSRIFIPLTLETLNAKKEEWDRLRAVQNQACTPDGSGALVCN